MFILDLFILIPLFFIPQINTSSLLENWPFLNCHSTMAEGHTDATERLSDPLVLGRSDLSDPLRKAGLVVPRLSSEPRSPITSSCFVTSPTSDALKFASRSPSPLRGDPVSAAAHLHLLGESLSLIGQHLQDVNVSKSQFLNISMNSAKVSVQLKYSMFKLFVHQRIIFSYEMQ